jgi:ADP-ribose pyrophosphatase YjhB (NUDIX family)
MSDTRPLFTLAAFAVIFDEQGRVLLCHRRDMDAWNLPGGGLEPGELPDECVAREVLEETGLVAVVERLVGIYGKAERNELIFAFICRITGGELRLTDESDAYAYYFPEKMPPNTLQKHIERIWDAVAAKDGALRVVYRHQAGQPGKTGWKSASSRSLE